MEGRAASTSAAHLRCSRPKELPFFIQPLSPLLSSALPVLSSPSMSFILVPMVGAPRIIGEFPNDSSLSEWTLSDGLVMFTYQGHETHGPLNARMPRSVVRGGIRGDVLLSKVSLGAAGYEYTLPAHLTLATWSQVLQEDPAYSNPLVGRLPTMFPDDAADDYRSVPGLSGGDTTDEEDGLHRQDIGVDDEDESTDA